MGTALEIERKYLVEFPKSWSELAELFTDLKDIKRISQTYLKAKGNEPAARVRKTIEGLTGDTEVVYHYNQKVFVQAGVHEETENEISKSKYDKFLKDADPKKVEVEKIRFVFCYEKQMFELDVFKGRLKGLAILEIELKNTNQKVKLPPFLKVIKEVTEDKNYNNFNLANKNR